MAQRIKDLTHGNVGKIATNRCVKRGDSMLARSMRSRVSILLLQYGFLVENDHGENQCYARVWYNQSWVSSYHPLQNHTTLAGYAQNRHSSMQPRAHKSLVVDSTKARHGYKNTNRKSVSNAPPLTRYPENILEQYKLGDVSFCGRIATMYRHTTPMHPPEPWRWFFSFDIPNCRYRSLTVPTTRLVPTHSAQLQRTCKRKLGNDCIFMLSMARTVCYCNTCNPV